MMDAVSSLTRLREEGGFYTLGPRTSVRITGADRVRYLNGQVSNDVGKLEPGFARPALVLTAKGKLCADVVMWSDGESLRIDADPAVAESLSARLERYAVADDVEFDFSASPAQFHVFGPGVTPLKGLRIQRLGVEGVDLDSRPSDLREASADEVECLRIERGIPRWGFELGEDTLPQEAGLERTAVDFHKGCYVGQEVVSRLQSVGRANRILSGFLGDFDPEACRKASLFSAAGKKAGTLTSAIFHPEWKRTIALGYVDRRIEELTFSVCDHSGVSLGRAERREFSVVS